MDAADTNLTKTQDETEKPARSDFKILTTDETGEYTSHHLWGVERSAADDLARRWAEHNGVACRVVEFGAAREESRS